MKKIFLLAFALAATFSFLGVYSLSSAYQPVPVTLAQAVQTETLVEPKVITRSASTATILASTETAIPTQTPTALVPTVVAYPVVTQVAPLAEQVLLDQFIRSVTVQKSDLVTGVYVPGRFSLPVLQQPSNDANFVSTQEVSATQFRSAASFGTIGLLAHNYLSGKKYFDLRIGDETVVVYGNGNHEHYRITKIERYQALSPTSPYSDFIDLNDPSQTKLSAAQVFQREYTMKNRVVFQTCIEANGDPSWGRIFVIAEKISQ